MSLVGRSFKVINNSKMDEFDILNGDVLKVQEEYKADVWGFGATKVERVRGNDSQVLLLSPFSGYWCYFSESMIKKGELVEVGKGHEQSVVNKMNAELMMTLEERYNNWIVENIHVYELFCEFAIKAIQSGKKRISHWLIVNRLRWEVEIETKGTCYQDKDFKISNDYIAFLARDFMKDYPQYGEVFKIKQMKRV